jgi:hypothetical protein
MPATDQIGQAAYEEGCPLSTDASSSRDLRDASLSDEIRTPSALRKRQLEEETTTRRELNSRN